MLIWPFVVGAGVGTGLISGFRSYFKQKEIQKLSDLKDAPFKFDLSSNNDSYYIVFDFGDDMYLWCDYTYGIREDGMYGVNEIMIKGLNSPWRSDFNLKVGQSVFPLMNRMEQLTDWLENQPLELKWDEGFRRKWEDTKKKINNLRYLETKSKEKDKKQK